MGPIKIIKLMGDSYPSDGRVYKNFTLTLKVPVELSYEGNTDVKPQMDECGCGLEDSGYRDGRHPFYREMFCEALSKMLLPLVIDSVVRHFQKIFGSDTMYESEDGRSRTNAAYHHAWEWEKDKRPYVYVDTDHWECSLKEKKQ